MKTAALTKILHSLTPAERAAAAKWLWSPAHNRRSDVRRLYQLLDEARDHHPQPTKAWLHAALFPGTSYDNRRLNLVFTLLAATLEDFLAWRDWQSNAVLPALHRGRAFRRRGLLRHFEREHARLSQRQHRQPFRHSEFWLHEYQRHAEQFTAQNHLNRADAATLSATAGQALGALSDFFLLAALHWLCTAESLRAQGAPVITPPLAEAVLTYAAAIPAETNPAAALLYHCYRALADPDDEHNFAELKALIERHAGLFPPAERRDLYMAAINFCIRRHNRGEAAYTREAFELYRTALTAGLLFEQDGVLPVSTYTNMHNLAHLVGAQAWAQTFLDEYAAHLPAAERDNAYRFNRATYHFRRGQYGEVLDLLRHIEFSERFMHLDARKMLLRAYYERGEWLALDSLLESFDAYLRRQKRSGYHLESYRNLVRFTKKLLRLGPSNRLAERIRTTEAVAERSWLLEKVECSA